MRDAPETAARASQEPPLSHPVHLWVMYGLPRAVAEAAIVYALDTVLCHAVGASVMLPICAPQIAAAVKTRKNPAFFWAPPPFCNKKALLVRPRSGKNEPFRSLGCRFVDRNVALLSHPVPQTAVLYGRTQKRHAQEHRVENWSYSAAPVRAAGADQAKMAWLAAGSKALLYCFRFSAGCCLAAASAAALDLHRLLAAAHPQMRPRGRPESSAGASDKPALSFSWFSLCVAAASGVSFVRIITSHSSVNPLL